MTFDKPTTFIAVGLETPKFQKPASSVEFAAIIREFLEDYLDTGRGYSHMTTARAEKLGEGLLVSSDPDEIRERGKPNWLLVTPYAVKSSRTVGPPSLGISIDNSMAPGGIIPNPVLNTTLGTLAANDLHSVDRTILVSLSLDSIPMSFSLLDEIYTLLISLSGVLEKELKYRTIVTGPVKRASEEESSLFDGFNGDPLLFSITGTFFLPVCVSCCDAP